MCNRLALEDVCVIRVVK